MSSTAAEWTICEIPRDLTIKQRPKIESWSDLQFPSFALRFSIFLVDIFFLSFPALS